MVKNNSGHNEPDKHSDYKLKFYFYNFFLWKLSVYRQKNFRFFGQPLIFGCQMILLKMLTLSFFVL